MSIHIVTGAFGYSGRYIAERLLKNGKRVRTITNSADRDNLFGGRLEVFPLRFDDKSDLEKSLQGGTVLYNTYWVRFNYKSRSARFCHSEAVENTLRLFDAAKRVGIKRIVHTSITNPSIDSPLEYFSGKARIEQRLIESGLSYAILRPAVLFGREDVLINNIAWMLRRFPVFGVFGDGQYRLQPIFVDDFAKIAVEQGHGRTNVILHAIGPETFTYKELVRTIGAAIGKKRPVIGIPDWLGYTIARIVGRIFHDVVITKEEIRGLKSDLLYVDASPLGTTKLSAWAAENAALLGANYTSELARRTISTP